MAEYIDRELAIQEIQSWDNNGFINKPTSKIPQILSKKNVPTADVIERSKIDKTIAEIKELYTEWENSTDDARLESNPFGAVLNIIQRNIGE